MPLPMSRNWVGAWDVQYACRGGNGRCSTPLQGRLLHQLIRRLPDVALLPKYLMLWPVLKPPGYCPHASRAAESPQDSGSPRINTLGFILCSEPRAVFISFLNKTNKPPQRLGIFFLKTFVLFLFMCLWVPKDGVGSSNSGVTDSCELGAGFSGRAESILNL